MLEAMRVRHMEWLTREADPVRCGHLQSFAAQIAAMQRTIAPLLENLDPEHDRNWEGALLRGVFLTSARQEPLSIDALLPELSRRFAMPRIGMLPPDLGLDEEEYGYFIPGILKKVVLPEAGLVFRNRKSGAARLGAWGLIGVIVLASAGTGYWIFSVFDQELKLAGRTYEEASAIKPVANPARRADMDDLLRSLLGLEDIRNILSTQSKPRDFALGLSARPLLLAAIGRAEHAMRVNALAEHLAARLEAELVDMNADAGTLKRRLELAAEAGNPDSPLLRDWLAEKAEEIEPAERHAFATHGMAAVRDAGGLRIGAAYVDAARRLIAYRESLS
jgi:type VI protein secretion system component VasK